MAKVTKGNVFEDLGFDPAESADLALRAYLMAEIRKFFQEYKTLEGKDVAIDEIQGVETAVKIIREALQLYRSEIEVENF